MAYIYFCGRPVPIHLPNGASVKTFKDHPNISFYDSEKAKAAAALKYPATKRSYSLREGGNDFPDFASLEAANAVPNNTALNNFCQKLAGDENNIGGIYQIAIHYDYANTAGQTFGILCNRGLSTHFLIDENGNLEQYLDCAHVAYATNACNNHSIAVDLHNPVSVNKKSFDKNRVERAIVRGVIQGKNREMLGYFDAQFDTLVALIKALTSPVPDYKDPVFPNWIPLRRFATRYAPPSENGFDVINHLVSNIVNFEGMIGHYHCNPEKQDPGPAFDWHRILRALSGVKNSLPLDYKGKHDIGQFGNDSESAFNHLYQRAEIDAKGGWYPIGANQAWHSGIHLPTKGTEPVYNMIEGRIIAIRNVRHTELGDPSFVLIEHDRNHPTEMEGENPKIIHWYTLYMHMKQMSEPWSKKKGCEIPWMQKLIGDEFEGEEAFKGYDSDGEDENLHILPPKLSTLGIIPVDENGLGSDFADDSIKTEIRRQFALGYVMLVNIPVAVGEQIGFSGKFETVNTYMDGEYDGYDDLENMIHLESFSVERPTDLFARNEADLETWTILEGATRNKSKASIKTLLAPIQRYVADRNGAIPSILKTSEIDEFFSDSDNTEAVERFRRFVALHISEWSPDMNWTDTAINTVGWQWESEKSFGHWYMQWIPFQWMTVEFLETLGLSLNAGRVYTYNPIYLLEQLNKSFSGGSKNASGASDDEVKEFVAKQNESMKKLAALKNLNAAELTPEQLDQIRQLEEIAASTLDDSTSIVDDNYSNLSDDEFDEYEPTTDFKKQEFGEWAVPKKKGARSDDDDDDYGED